MDAVLRFSFMSDRLREVTGVDPCSTLGKTRQEIGAGDTDAEKWETHLADLSAHRPFREFRYLYVAARGDRPYWTIRGVPLFAENGRLLRSRGTGRPLPEARQSAV